MKKIIDFLFSDKQIAAIIDFCESRFTLSVITAATFAIFKNGIEISGSRYSGSVPVDPLHAFEQISGNVRVSVNPGDIIELRQVSGGANIAVSDPAVSRGTINITKVA